jgi:hypothetical protein
MLFMIFMWLQNIHSNEKNKINPTDIYSIDFQ